jgi:hypothetical protein
MVKRIAAFWMMGQMLFGSIALPLGDYSMIKELPRMYQAYEKVVSPDEKGILDFIGDYVLNGKDLLGHNQHDQPSKPGALQLQGSPSFAVALQPSLTLPQPLLPSSGTRPSRHHFSAALSDYHPSLFRPPLA